MQAFRAKTAGIDLISPERASRSGAAQPRRLDYIDVEFETVAASARRSPYPTFNDKLRAGGRPAPATTTVRENESGAWRILAAVEARLSAMPRRRFASLVAALGLAAFVLITGSSRDGQADTHPLSVEGISASLEDSGGMRVLAVYGSVENHSAGQQRLPPVFVEVTNGGRRVTTTRLMLDGMPMAPGESRRFVTRLPYTGGKEPDVTVSFAENSASDR